MAERPFPSLPCRIREAAKSRKGMEQELAHAVNSSSLALSEVLACKSSSGATEVSVGSCPKREGPTCRAGDAPWVSLPSGLAAGGMPFPASPC